MGDVVASIETEIAAMATPGTPMAECVLIDIKIGTLILLVGMVVGYLLGRPSPHKQQLRKSATFDDTQPTVQPTPVQQTPEQTPPEPDYTPPVVSRSSINGNKTIGFYRVDKGDPKVHKSRTCQHIKERTPALLDLIVFYAIQ